MATSSQRQDLAPIARAYANVIWKGTRDYNDETVAYLRVKDNNFYASTSVVQYMLLDVYKMKTINQCKCTKINFKLKTDLDFDAAWKKYIVDTGYKI